MHTTTTGRREHTRWTPATALQHAAGGAAIPNLPPAASSAPAVSVIVPVRDEAENIEPLLAEIHAAMQRTGSSFEVIYVDDGSTDGTAEVLLRARRAFPGLRTVRHPEPCGQSAALRTGAMQARGHTLVMLDGDLQNDPADIPALLEELWSSAEGSPTGLVAGQRRKREDRLVRRAASRVANSVRGRLLNDGVRDTGCGLKVFPRAVFLRLPYFDHLHRFLPALIQREGFGVRLVEVNHRPRLNGGSKYGTLDRLWVGIVDLLGVMWLQRRFRQPSRLLER